MLRSPMRCIANSKARWKQMTSTTPPATKGQAHGGGKKSLGRRARGRRKKREPGRGHYDKDRPAMIAWVSRQGAVVIQATRDFTAKTVQKAADLAVQAGSRLSTDSASSYRALKGYVHAFVNHTQKEYARGDVHENRAEYLFSLNRYKLSGVPNLGIGRAKPRSRWNRASSRGAGHWYKAANGGVPQPSSRGSSSKGLSRFPRYVRSIVSCSAMHRRPSNAPPVLPFSLISW